MTLRHVLNLGNSILGVSVLAMPYCFKNCGIVLSIVMIILSGLLNRAGCYLILKSARISKRKNFEHLAYTILGSTGKFIVELTILGFSLGGIIAFFIVIGDLGPSLLIQIFNISDSPHLRVFIMTFLGMFVALPLGLLRRVERLASFSAISIFLYFFLIFYLFTEVANNLVFTNNNKLPKNIIYWNFDNIWSTLPIFVSSFSCQPQLFEIFEHSFIFSEDSGALRHVNKTIKQVIDVCSFLYIIVGLLGYLAFFEYPIHGNILINFSHNAFAILAKFGFIFITVLSVPLYLFPCRTCLYGLYKKPKLSLLNEMNLSESYIPDEVFRKLTILLIVFTICISILIPRIEFILGILGSTTGAFVCLILPGIFFKRVTYKNTGERILAFILIYVGLLILVLCTYTLITTNETDPTIKNFLNRNLNETNFEKFIQKKIKSDLTLNKINDEHLVKSQNFKDNLVRLSKIKNVQIESSLNSQGNHLINMSKLNLDTKQVKLKDQKAEIDLSKNESKFKFIKLNLNQTFNKNQSVKINSKNSTKNQTITNNKHSNLNQIKIESNLKQEISTFKNRSTYNKNN